MKGTYELLFFFFLSPSASLVYGVSSSVVRRFFLIYLLFFFSLLQCISALFSSIMMLVHIYFRDFFSTLFFSVLEYAFFHFLKAAQFTVFRG